MRAELVGADAGGAGVAGCFADFVFLGGADGPAPGGDEFAFGVEALDAAISAVKDVDVAGLVVDRDPAGSVSWPSPEPGAARVQAWQKLWPRWVSAEARGAASRTARRISANADAIRRGRGEGAVVWWLLIVACWCALVWWLVGWWVWGRRWPAPHTSPGVGEDFG